ncbi:putative cysteine-rich receptor-like protein kinase 35 [Bienertia sinuspersici]
MNISAQKFLILVWHEYLEATKIKLTPKEWLEPSDGYMSPEYTMGHFSEKYDVYSFRVILFEIVGGRKNSTFHRNE